MNLGVTAFINNLHNVQLPNQIIKPFNNKYYNADKEIQKFVGNYSDLLDENKQIKEDTNSQQRQQQQQQHQQKEQQQVIKRKYPNQQRKQMQEQKYGYCTSSESEDDRHEKGKNMFDDDDDSSDQDQEEEEKVQVVNNTDIYGDSGDETIVSLQDVGIESSLENEIENNETNVSKESLLKEIEDLHKKKTELENGLETLIGKDDTKNIIELIEKCNSDVDSAAEEIDKIISDKHPNFKEEITNLYLLFFSYDIQIEMKQKDFDDYDKKTKS